MYLSKDNRVSKPLSLHQQDYDVYLSQKQFASHITSGTKEMSVVTVPRQGTVQFENKLDTAGSCESAITRPQMQIFAGNRTNPHVQLSDDASPGQPVDFNLTYSIDKSPIEDLILNHINDSIISPSNISQILQAKNSLKLIRAADANYMNQTVFNKFAKTWAQRENVNTDTA